MLGAIIEHATDKSYQQAYAERIFKPAGMTETVPALLTPLVPKRALGYRHTFAGIQNAMASAQPAGRLWTAQTCTGGAPQAPAIRSPANARKSFCSACGK